MVASNNGQKAKGSSRFYQDKGYKLVWVHKDLVEMLKLMAIDISFERRHKVSMLKLVEELLWKAVDEHTTPKGAKK